MNNTTQTTKPVTEQDLLDAGIHPKIIAKYLKLADGSFRFPSHDEWMEDYGLGYLNRPALEGKSIENIKVG